MPLTDLIRYFNVADDSGDSTLYLEGQRAAAWYRGLRLTSLFQPIVDLRREKIVGHQAVLLARREDGREAGAAAAYAACETAAAVVHLDRLCRTLHALNFLAQRQYAGGYLQLSVHPRHLLAVPNQHGLVYEAILKRCGLAPEDIVLQIDAAQLGQQARMVEALVNYRQRGYRLALTGPLPADMLLGLQPEILQLPAGEGEMLIGPARRAGILLELGGISTGLSYAQARAASFDLGQGPLFGAPQATCHPTHDQRRVAYNCSSHSESHHENCQ